MRMARQPHLRKRQTGITPYLIKPGGEGLELTVLRMLSLFHRPADEKAIGVLLKASPIRGLKESFILV
jgi:hypothetical protein